MIDTAAFLLGVKIAWSEYPHNKLIRRLGDRVEKDAINREHERKLKVAVAISKLTSGSKPSDEFLTEIFNVMKKREA